MRSMRPGASRCNGVAVEVELRVELGDEEKARSLLEAVRPDDETAPPGLLIEEAVDAGDPVVRVSACADPRRIGSVRNTVDEVLEFTYAALRAIERAGAAGINPQRRPAGAHGGQGGGR